VLALVLAATQQRRLAAAVRAVAADVPAEPAGVTAAR
jgi:hypothetical protein